MRSLFFLAALLAGHAAANGLDDMKSALAPLQGMVPLRGAYEVHETRTRPGKAPVTLMAAALVREDAGACLVLDDSQFVIATHSPILMAYPDACIYEFSNRGIRPIAYQDTAHFKITRDFLVDHERMIARLFQR